ncbi:hypothetical protein VNI00_006937 [Paramarasmius palmivorus]|uniref:F-box domain-containing protein n=1 Tax=Paramarasmius palmivorus TaxID=297713 RepID=A0AAW0D2M9_9AGAR
MPKGQGPRSHPAPAISPSKSKGKKKTEDESFMEFYPGSKRRVDEETKAKIRTDPMLKASWQAHYEYLNSRTRTEDSADWPITLPREIMDIIMGDPSLGIREHLALAATCAALRRCYHHNDIWHDIRKMRCVSKNGRQVPLEIQLYTRRPPDSKQMLHLATSPQKKKANGPYFKELADPYSLHKVSIKDCWKHRITAQKAKELYPLVTDEHLARLRYFEQNHNGYPNQWTEEGYAEVCVEWMFYRVKAGMEPTPKIEEAN